MKRAIQTVAVVAGLILAWLAFFLAAANDPPRYGPPDGWYVEGVDENER